MKRRNEAPRARASVFFERKEEPDAGAPPTVAGKAPASPTNVVSANGMLCTAIIGSLLNFIAGFVNACVWREFGT